MAVVSPDRTGCGSPPPGAAHRSTSSTLVDGPVTPVAPGRRDLRKWGVLVMKRTGERMERMQYIHIYSALTVANDQGRHTSRFILAVGCVFICFFLAAVSCQESFWLNLSGALQSLRKLY